MNVLPIFIALVLGLIFGRWNLSFVNEISDIFASAFVSLLKVLSLPLVFLTLVSTVTHLDGQGQLKRIGIRVVGYTLLTTALAACVALGIYLLIDPFQRAGTIIDQGDFIFESHTQDYGFQSIFLKMIPENFLDPFISGNVIGILLLGLLMSGAILQLQKEHKEVCQKLFGALAAVFLKMAQIIVKVMPIAVFAFVVKFMGDLNGSINIKPLMYYVLCVTGANLLQAFLVLPTFLIIKGVSPFRLAVAMKEALIMAFFSKSSAATLPVTMSCMEKKAKVSSELTRTVLPMCTTINMNACAAFILITYLFVTQMNGLTFTLLEQIAFIFVATLAAVGNAAVPMGCFFLTSALLAASDIPLALMGMILPIYGFLDMLETAINVWSDACVTKALSKDLESTL